MLTGHEVIIKRNIYFRNFYRANIIILFMLVFGLCLNFYIYLIFSKEKASPEYFLTNASGRIIRDAPLSVPIYPDDDLAQWTQNSLEEIFNINYVSFANTLKKTAQYFTPLGYRQYLGTLKQSKNVLAIQSNKYIVVTSFLEPMRVVKKIQSPGSSKKDTRQLWVLEGKARLHYVNSENIAEPMYQDINLSVVVTRQSFYLYENGIAIAIIIGNSLQN